MDASAWRNQSPPVSLSASEGAQLSASKSASRKRCFAEEVIWSFHGYLQVHLLECQYPKQTNIFVLNACFLSPSREGYCVEQVMMQFTLINFTEIVCGTI